MIHPALRMLLRLRMKALLRRMSRGAFTLRGAIPMLVAILGIGGLLFQGVFLATALGEAGRSKLFGSGLTDMAPIGLLMFTLFSILTSAGDRAIYFSPSDVDLLFPGPFTRRELLIYKFSSTVAGALFGSLVIALACAAYIRWWLAGFVGIFVSVIFINAVYLNVALLGQTIAEQAYTRGRRIVGVLLLIPIVLGLAQAISVAQANGLVATLRAFADTLPGKIVLAPFQIYGNTLNATTYASLAGWAAVALTVNGILMALAIRLDANYLESAVRVSQQMQRRLQQARRQGGGFAASAPESHWTLPQLPRLGGFGVIVWSQILKAARTSRGMLIVGILMLVVISVLLTVNQKFATATTFPMVAIGAMAYLSLLMSFNSPMGFRADVDQMEFLKALPITSTAIAAGEVLCVTLLLGAVQVTLLAIVAVITGSYVLLGWAIAFAIPFNALIFGLDSLVFLLYPARATPSTPGDIQSFGRFMVQSFIKMAVFFLLILPAALLGVLGWYFSGSLHAIPTVILLAVAVTDVLLVLGVAWAFRRFDISTDMPV